MPDEPTANASRRDRDFQRILLIKPSALGDVIHTLPVLRRLRARFPAARIDWLLTPALADLLRHHPDLSNVVVFDRRKLGRIARPIAAGAGIAGLLAKLRKPRYDLVIDLHGQIRSGFFALVTGARTRIGFDRPRRAPHAADRRLPDSAYRHGWTGAREGAWMAYTHRIPIQRLDVHAVDRYLWLGDMLGFESGPIAFDLPIADAWRESVAAKLAQRGVREQPLAVMSPGTIWETKRWTVAGFAAVAKHLRDRGQTVVLIGAPNEAERCRDVAQACPGVFDLCGQTSIPELAALIDRATVVITNDSGPMHLAAALGRPVVAMFGPTDELWVGPYGQPQGAIRLELDCAPCYLRRLSRCPHGHRCMRDLRAENVIKRLNELPLNAVGMSQSARALPKIQHTGGVAK
ncbi:MAG: glycosyltransferase family 9 protein [Phycisphaerales bacterium]|nr:glycosyltransferase family 9 protein [Phycisphaerales bacterium]